MAHAYSTPNSRLDDDARRLTQDYPAFGENLSRASSRSSNASNSSRSAYPRVPEDILDQIDKARSARDQALANWNAARRNADVTQALFYVGCPPKPSTGATLPRLAAPTLLRAVLEQPEIRLKQAEDPRNLGHTANAEAQVTDKTFARIKRTRAKFVSSHVISPPRPLLPPPLPVPSPSWHSPQPLVQLVPENLAPLLQGEELRKRAHMKRVDNLKVPRTERDHVELSSRDIANPSRLPPPSIPMSPLLQLASQFSSLTIPKDTAQFLEQGEDPRDLDHRADIKMNLEDKHSQVADGPDFARSERDYAKVLDRHVDPRRSTPSLLLAAFPLQTNLANSAPLLEQGKPAPDLNYGASSKTGEEFEIVGEREEETRNVLDSRAQSLECYEYEHRSTTSVVPLGREQCHVSNMSRTENRPVPVRELTIMPAMQQLDEPEPEEHKVHMCTFTNQISAPSKGLLGMYQHSHTRAQLLLGEGAQEVPPNQPVLNSPPPLGNYAFKLGPSRSPSFLRTTSNRGSVSWSRPRDLGMPVRHIVGGFGGEEGSPYGSSESEYGGRNGGGGRPPGWGDDDPGDPDHNDDQPRRGRHGDNEPRRGSCGGGPPGGDPLDDGEPEGGRYGNSKRSNQKDSKKRRGVTPFSEIPEEGSPHYGYEYFEYKGEPPTSLKKPLKEKVFTRFAMLIEWHLFTKMQVMGDSKAQRNLVNSIPKIKQYNGQNSIVVLDNFLRGLIRHMEIQGLTGPPRIKDSEGTSVVTNEDAGRTILMAGNLSEAALEWYQTYAEHPPDSFKRGMKASTHRRTFLQIFRALFDHFITGVALKEIDASYNEVKYTMLGGIRQLFSDMKMYVEMMPVPPDEYQFKDNLLEKLPQSMRRIVLNDGLGPNTATTDEIMQRALAVESGWEAEAYYDTTGSQLNVSESETDTEGESESGETQEGGGSGGTQQQRLLKSWLKTQAN
ncbi:hypothetical protein K435DRAFT_810001 [Dendrothele bispora CBS 962.96]|uniref:Uncharacterized protein n=1 Tax=Dendrothele bispora (strain CBS 962.96) TaxID=1314807 RepID=A0A4S8KWC7_DENBC|nr:hypothetical protein K435DRAFT_810001 [Dendrothele bispora CBS 962.96]